MAMKSKPTYQELQAELLKLKQIEREYKSTIENLQVGIVVHAADTSIILSNRKAREILGLKEEQMQGKKAIDPAWNFIHEDKSIMKVENYPVNKIILSKEPFDNYILGIIKPINKSITWVNVKASAEFNKKGEIKNIIISFIDITEITKANNALRRSENELKRAQSIAQIGSWVMDANTKQLFWSKQMYKMLEVSSKEVPTFELYFSRVHPDDLAYVQEIGGRVYQNNEAAKAEYRLLLPSGSIKYIATEGRQFMDDENNIIKLSGIAQDITERKKTEFELNNAKEKAEESEEKLRLIGDNIPMGLIFQLLVKSDGTSRFTYLSKKVEELHESTVEEVLKDPSLLFSRVLPEDIPGLQAATEKSIQGMCVYDHVVRIRRKSGDIRWHRMISRPRKLDNRDVLFDGIDLDITEQKNAEQALKNNEQKLKKANITKDKFFSIISHDLRSPYTALLYFSNILLKKHKEYDDEKLEEIIKLVINTATSAFKLLENLLTWSLAQSGQINFLPEKLDLNTLLTETMFDLQETANKKNIQVLNTISENELIYADRNMIATILRNLISNAIKFTNKNGKIVISSEKEVKSNFLKISVEDTGLGISKKKIDNIFRIDKNTSTKGTENETGTGLGLILCKEFVEKHGGKIWAKSVIGQGSIFNFSIPINTDSQNIK